MSMSPKVCPECGEEYLHTATTCAHCDVGLVLPEDLPAARRAEDLPPVSELHCVRASSLGWALSLSEKLREVGIAHRIQAATDDDEEGGERRPGHLLPYGIYVQGEDVEAAAAIDAAHTETQIPDIPDDFDPAAPPAESDACPACGTPVEADAAECADCGLVLGPAG